MISSGGPGKTKFLSNHILKGSIKQIHDNQMGTIKFRTTRRTWRDTAARDNQIEDDVEDVERYCGNCAM
jgi:hypothetical protein